MFLNTSLTSKRKLTDTFPGLVPRETHTADTVEGAHRVGALAVVAARVCRELTLVHVYKQTLQALGRNLMSHGKNTTNAIIHLYFLREFRPTFGQLRLPW